MNLFVLLGIVAAMVVIQLVVTRWIKLNRLSWLAIWWVALWAAFSYGINPPLPNSIIVLFMAIITIALTAYLSADNEELAKAWRSIVRFMVEKEYRIALVIVLFAIPAAVAARTYISMNEAPQPPSSARTIHPPPPLSITFEGNSIDLATANNPFRELEHTDEAAFAEHVNNGRRIYFENCFYCHGDNMEGAGMFAHGYDPIPANFNDATTIAMLQESYLFWRIAKGAPGLPSESTPWSSAMPAWELFLTEEEIWDVILFLYEYTGFEPRAQGMPH
ncbi:MAG: cytochrome c [Rhodothermaceae bacterium]|nr:cytochrome c [Rhodothermaceae bacterium]MXZ58047.1 cytochrome c [Rhodothermaceae bacterium]MYB90184.1 cytochrome c [Rhodothermaceae bacterium]MYD67222.1 cytochrome c [Rhodothermaceae bacterium]MYG43675.1 cytochrome c [Rhodothermaceae bacterium]